MLLPDQDILVIKANEVDGFSLPAKEVHLTFTLDSVTKKTKSYLFSPKVEINEFVDFELRKDSKYFTLFLYSDKQQGQTWAGTADVNIADVTKGTEGGKQLSLELVDLNQKYLPGNLCVNKAE